METIKTTRSFAEIEHSTVRKVSKRLIPFLFICFAISILDRLNISFAALQMNETLGFSNEVYGLGAGIFFLGYFLLEVPGGALMTKFGARKWISRIMISWGIISGLTAFVTTPTQFYVIRFALGVAEASFFPCMAWYLSQWYQTKHHARALAGFMAAIPAASALGSPISGYLLTVDLWGFHGWQNLFILEAIPSVILGVITYFYLTDKIEDAKWLEQDEKEWLVKILAKEEALKRKKKSITFLQALKERDVLILACAYFCWMAGYYGVIMFLPTLIASLSGSMGTSMLGWLIGFMYLLAAITMVSVGRSSDKRQERRFHVATSLIVFGSRSRNFRIRCGNKYNSRYRYLYHQSVRCIRCVYSVLGNSAVLSVRQCGSCRHSAYKQCRQSGRFLRPVYFRRIIFVDRFVHHGYIRFGRFYDYQQFNCNFHH